MIGILSGSGPEAGLAIVQEMHKYLQIQYGAKNDLDYPDYVLYNKPLRGFGVTGIENIELLKSDFENALKNLDNMNVQTIGIACNTLHGLLDNNQKHINAEIVNIIYETCKEVENYENILILCSETTTKKELYNTYLKKTMGKINVHTLFGDRQKTIDSVIEAAMGGNQGKNEVDKIRNVISLYQSESKIDAVILGCTELPLVFSQKDCSIPIISSNTVLAKQLLKKYLSNKLS